MIALFSQAAVCPDQMQTRLRAPNADGLESAHLCTEPHTGQFGAAKRVFEGVCVTFPGPDLLRDSQEGLEGLGYFGGFVRVRISECAHM
jgi:hypothetical protein